MEFQSFAKIARLNRECAVTEKIDGTNGCVAFAEDGQMFVGSRTRWITPQDDNFGFAAWCHANRSELEKLGPGAHYGEWWGSGIQRKYGLTNGDKRFSLFNVHRWSDPEIRPACCSVVPELARGVDIRAETEKALALLREHGSFAASGFPKPEGVVIYHTASGGLYKVTLEKDEAPKGNR
jgi:hypothetical protein